MSDASVECKESWQLSSPQQLFKDEVFVEMLEVKDESTTDSTSTFITVIVNGHVGRAKLPCDISIHNVYGFIKQHMWIWTNSTAEQEEPSLSQKIMKCYNIYTWKFAHK